MAFANTNSLTATDANNMLRGLTRDNSDHAVTGTTSETDMASLSITGGTVGATGCLHIVAAGTITNVASAAKTVKLVLGSTTIATVSRTAANAQDWTIDAWMFNTASNAQRWRVIYSTADATTVTMDYITSSVDTSSNQTLKLTGTLVSASDTITQTAYDVFVAQVT